MNLQDELFDSIENYLNEGMSDTERFAFEERIAQNKVLSDKVAEVRAANTAIYYASLAELKNTIGQDLKNIKYKPPVDWKKAGIISVASLAILSGVTTYFISGNKTEIETNKTVTNKTETDNNSIRTENVSEQENKSALSKEKSIEVLNSLGSSVKKESIDTLQANNTTKQKNSTVDTIKNNIVKEIKSSASENKIQLSQSQSTIKKVEIPVLKEDKIVCDKSFKITAEASCKEKETGSIAVISDGAYSYTYQLDIQSKTGSKGVFTNLSTGSYDLLVTYAKECTYKQKVTIGEKWCAMNHAYSFNPDYNEKWKPMYESGTSGTILIYDKQGKEIYNLPFGSGNEEWIGNDKQGMPVSVGIYIAFINYSDGRKEKVELTVVR